MAVGLAPIGKVGECECVALEPETGYQAFAFGGNDALMAKFFARIDI